MKKLFYFILALFFFVPLIGENAFAQSAQAKQTANASRLLAVCRYSGDTTSITPSDSTHYNYPNLTTANFSQIMEYLFSAGAWNNGYRHDYFYNGAGFQIKKQTSQWNATKGAYDVASRDTFVLDAAGNAVQETIAAWNPTTSTWVPTQQWVSSYNAYNKRTRYDYQSWSASASSWVNGSRNDLSYDTSGVNLISMVTSSWDATSNMFTPYLKDFYIYNAFGQLSRDSFSRISTTTGTWAPNGCYTFSYDSRGNQILYVLQSWNTATHQFDLNSRKSVLLYNSNNQVVVDSILNWSNGSSPKYQLATLILYYYESATGIGSAAARKEALLSIIPNPASDALQLSVKWDDVQAFSASITDMQGRVYQTLSAPAAKEFSTTLSLKELPSGNYLFSIRGSAGSNASRMITVRR